VLPPLENGDRLSRAEFERRYAAALRFRSHAQLIGWLFNYQIATIGTALADNATVRLDLDNESQPDVALFIEPMAGGRIKISNDDW
jgi:hypothetical protein